MSARQIGHASGWRSDTLGAPARRLARRAQLESQRRQPRVGPGGLRAWADRAADPPVLACSLLPMGVRFAELAAPGVHDVGLEVWGQPDASTAVTTNPEGTTSRSWMAR